MHFHLPYLNMFQEEGWETSVAARNDYEDPTDCNIPHCNHYYDIPFERSPLKFDNIRAYRALKKLLSEEHYDIIHCHTPMGGVLARLAARKYRKRGTKVIYTAHGFHFYKGAPLKNWLLYYPVEWLCAHWTDTLIAINQEDYALAKKCMHAKNVVFVPGVGVDFTRFDEVKVNRAAMRRELGVPKDAVLLLSVGELIQRKNHEVVIRAVADLDRNDIYYFVAGQGELEGQLAFVIRTLDLVDRVKLLGYRKDIPELLKIADIFVFPSLHEGLPVALMEALACNMPVVCSNIRGNKDLVKDGVNGRIVKNTVYGFKDGIQRLVNSIEERTGLGIAAKETVRCFELTEVLKQMRRIYEI